MAETTSKSSRKTAVGRYGWIVLFFSIIFIAILVCIINTKYVEGPMWREIGREVMVSKEREVLPNRGNIYSDDGRLLATSEPLYGIYVDFMAEGIKKDTLMKYVTPLSQELAKRYPSRSAAQYKKIFMDGWALSRKELAEVERVRQSGSKKRVKTKSRYIRIIPQDINYVQLKELRTLPFFNKRSNQTGMIAEEKTRRLKPFGRLAGRTVGSIYKDIAMGGSSGLELKYDSILRGEPGVKNRQRNSGRWTDVILVQPKDGWDVQTTLNVDIQDMAERALNDKLVETKAESGTAIVMEVETGEIKALVNLDRISDGVYGEGNPNAFSYMSEPGSTFKTISLMIALEDGVVTPDEEFHVGNGQFQYGKRIVKDHDWRKGKDRGNVTVAQGMYSSLNTVIAKMILKGYEDNPKKYVQRMEEMGLMKKLTWDVPVQGREGTTSIRYPDDKYNPWSKTTLPWMSFGYETQFPPIYMLMFYNGIANNGKMLKPFLTKAFTNNGSVEEEFEAEVIKDKLCSDKTLQQVKDILRGVVTDGTAKAVNSDLVEIAGKTGTAMIASKGGYSGYYVSFCGYFPSDKPKYTIFVGIRRPQGSPSGGLMPGAVFRRIAEGIFVRNIADERIKAPADTIHALTPKIKVGYRQYTEYVLDKLHQKYTSDDLSTWSSVETNDQGAILIQGKEIKDGLTPSVIGMGAKDAVYLLESKGLRVHLTGAGKVVEQSIPAGSRLITGSTITIRLN